MVSLKEAQRSAAIAFSPNASYLAAGAGAGAIDTAFSTSSTLEVRHQGVFYLLRLVSYSKLMHHVPSLALAGI